MVELICVCVWLQRGARRLSHVQSEMAGKLPALLAFVALMLCQKTVRGDCWQTNLAIGPYTKGAGTYYTTGCGNTLTPQQAGATIGMVIRNVRNAPIRVVVSQSTSTTSNFTADCVAQSPYSNASLIYASLASNETIIAFNVTRDSWTQRACIAIQDVSGALSAARGFLHMDFFSGSPTFDVGLVMRNSLSGNYNPSGVSDCQISSTNNWSGGFNVTVSTASTRNVSTCIAPGGYEVFRRQLVSPMSWNQLMSNPGFHRMRVWLLSGSACDLDPRNQCLSSLYYSDRGVASLREARLGLTFNASAACPHNDCCMVLSCDNTAGDGVCGSLQASFSASVTAAVEDRCIDSSWTQPVGTSGVCYKPLQLSGSGATAATARAACKAAAGSF